MLNLTTPPLSSLISLPTSRRSKLETIMPCCKFGCVLFCVFYVGHCFIFFTPTFCVFISIAAILFFINNYISLLKFVSGCVVLLRISLFACSSVFFTLLTIRVNSSVFHPVHLVCPVALCYCGICVVDACFSPFLSSSTCIHTKTRPLCS